MKSLGPLHEATRDLHHAVEMTALGRAMSEGRPTYAQYARWLAMKGALHCAVDPFLPESLRRSGHYFRDMACIGWIMPVPESIEALIADIEGLDQGDLAGLLYVLIGGNMMGGEVIRRRLVENGCRWPMSCFMDDETRKRGMPLLLKWRQIDDPKAVALARKTFQALIDAGACEPEQDRFSLSLEAGETTDA